MIKRRNLKRHFSLFLLGSAGGAGLSVIAGPNSGVEAISLASAYAAFGFITAALFTGASVALRMGRPILSQKARRHFGIWAGVFGIIHVAAGLFVHFGGKFWLYFIFPANQQGAFPLRYDFFGVANYLGVLAAVIIIILLALSNNTALKKYGPKKWKKLQRLAYPLLLLVFTHGLIYQLIEKRMIGLIMVIIAAFMIVVFVQFRGYRKVRQNNPPSSPEQ